MTGSTFVTGMRPIPRAGAGRGPRSTGRSAGAAAGAAAVAGCRTVLGLVRGVGVGAGDVARAEAAVLGWGLRREVTRPRYCTPVTLGSAA